jgi:NAD(P)-dependent dehydrogenase (short-subunit alcohol dehydrogenase family)/3-hydroxymyristoyl/3-hydroxydecanoyl-(acyl carrier protein) dehydratase
LIEDTLRDPGTIEIGWQGELRYGIALIERALPTQGNFAIQPGSVFLVSGGSAGIVTPILEDLTKASQGIFYLLGRTALPEPGNADIQRLRTDREGLKKDLIARLLGNGNKTIPAKVEQELLRLERAASALQTLDAVRSAGGIAHYLICDVTDPLAVDAAVQKVLQAEGRVDIFLHAAGFEHSRKLESKPLMEFQQVVAVKADGFFNIFKALDTAGNLPRAVIFFSSVAGRFGNAGQTDYSAANDLLCKIASAMHNQYPGIKALALDWGAWAEIGMASRGSIPMLMEQAGIDMIKPTQAAPLVRTELLAGDGESVLAGSLGMLLNPRSPNGGLDLAAADLSLREGAPIHTMLSHITAYDLNQGLVLQADLDPQSQPFLRDHALNGVPVLPGVMGIEGFAAAAKHIASMLASNKGVFEVRRLEEIEFLAAFKFYRNEPRRVTWIARAVREDSGLVVYVTLESSRANKIRTIEHMKHFTGKVYLELKSAEQIVTAQAPQWNGNYTVKAADIYRLYFHGPAFQVLEGVQRSGQMVLGKLHMDLPAITRDEQPLVSTPTLVELCFQTAGIWEIGKTGTMALPRSIQSLRLYRQYENGHPIFAEVMPTETEDGRMQFDARVVDERGRVYLELKNYRTIPLPTSPKEELLQPMIEMVKTA